MKKFRVMIEGKNFLLNGEVKERLGFYTTRYVEAKSESEATTMALNLIRDELRNNVVKESQYSPEMFVKEIIELESFEDAKVPGTGFSWFPMKKKSKKSN